MGLRVAPTAERCGTFSRVIQMWGPEFLAVLRELRSECQLHNRDYQHVTPQSLIDRANQVEQAIVAWLETAAVVKLRKEFEL